MPKPNDYLDDICEWYATEKLYTTKELIDYMKSYANQITIIADIIKERCRKEGFCIDIIKETQQQ